MNMISTGAFQTEMDASNKQLTLAEKFAAVWEKKNAKAARAGGVSLMALSLAACGSSDDATTTATTATTDTTTTTTTPTVVVNAAQDYTASTTSDKLVGDSGNDTFNATAATYVDADLVIDTTTTDADVVNITESAGITPNLTNVETVNIELQNALSVTLDVSSVTGATALNYSRGDVTLTSGSVVTGNKATVINNYSAADIGTVNVTGTVTSVDINAAATDKAGGVINAETATGAVDVDGAATINANASTGTVRIDTVSNTSVAEAGKATVINAAKAGTIFTDTLLNGSVTVNAAAATSVTVEDAGGGGSTTAATGTETTASTTITVSGIDKTGYTVTTGNFPSATLKGTIDLSGTAAASDVATVYGGGAIDLDVGKTGNAVDTINVGASEANVVYAVSSTNGAALAYTAVANDTYTIELDADESEFSGVEITNVDVIDLSAGTAGAIDGSAWTGVGKIDLGFDNAGNAISYGAGQTYDLTKDQVGLTLEMAATGSAQTVAINAGDDNGTSTAVGTITVGALNLNAGEDAIAGTVTLDATTANFTATSVDGGALMSLVITGDEDVTLGSTTFGAASSIDASASTGKISLTTTTLAPTVTTGSGADTVIVNGSDVHTVSTGAGIDTLTISSTNDGSTFDAGDGGDTVNVDDTDTYSVVGGAGADTFNTAAALKAHIFGGDGSDKIVIDGAGALTMNGAFRMTEIEEFDLTTAGDVVTLDDESFASDNSLVLIGDGAADIFRVLGDDTTGATIDASGVTVKAGSTVTIRLEGGTKADTITGGVAAETFLHSQGADVIEGGATGTDTFSIANSTFTPTGSGAAATGVIINMGTTAVVGASITASTSKFSAGGASVAAGTLGYAYDANAATNATTTQSLSDIEDILAGDGVDYIVGSDVANAINGNAGADYIDAGDGNDTITVDSTAEGTSDKIHGGAGEDTISITADTVLSATDTDITGVETIVLAGTAANDVTTLGQTEAFTITGNSNVNILKTGTGQHTIDLGAADASEDILVVGDNGFDQVSNFLSGTTNEDHLQLDISELEGAAALIAAKTLNFIEIKDENDVTAGDAGIQILTAAATAADAKNVFVMNFGTTKYANADAAVDALETGGTHALTFEANAAANDAFIIIYENTTGGSNVAAVAFVAADNNSLGAATTAAGNLDGVDLITIAGLATAESLVADNIAFI